MKRIDVYLVESGLIKSRTKAKEAILNGKVTVNGSVCSKPSLEISESDTVFFSGAEDKFVSRAGYKLESALETFGIDVSGLTALDIGASTGGFTDCLLQRGASFVYAVDVGTSQLDTSLLEDPRVESRENTNARYLKECDFDRGIDLIVMDVSFISQQKLYYAVSDILTGGKIFISLIKPQFELGKENIGKGGIVKDKKLYGSLIGRIGDNAKTFGLELKKVIESPIKGGDGNTEFLALFVKNANLCDHKGECDAETGTY